MNAASRLLRPSSRLPNELTRMKQDSRSLNRHEAGEGLPIQTASLESAPATRHGVARAGDYHAPLTHEPNSAATSCGDAGSVSVTGKVARPGVAALVGLRRTFVPQKAQTSKPPCRGEGCTRSTDLLP